ncbi:MAG: cytochrome c biogenesis CcdA family protein [Mycobacterium leprae]
MGTLLTTGSVLAAFFAGGVALFAPCCIVFLAPSYLAAAVKNRRWRLLPLTFAFSAGLAVVLVPITLGLGLVADATARWHGPLYWAGGLLMLGLAALALSGRTWSMPTFLPAPDTTRGDSAGMFALGVFSGVASSCCAPVLAGVMTLSALSGTPFGATLLGLAYVFGMTFPLFVLALLWDRLRLGERRLAQARPVRLRLGGRTLVTNSVAVAVAIVFAIMGSFRALPRQQRTDGLGSWNPGRRRARAVPGVRGDPVLGGAGSRARPRARPASTRRRVRVRHPH